MDKRLSLGFWSIPRKLLLLLLIIFLPASGIIVALRLAERQSAIEDAEDEVMLLVRSLAAQQEQMAVGTRQMLSTLALLPEVQDMDAAACNELFSELYKKNSFYSFIGAVTPDGKVFASALPFDPGTDLSDRKHVRDAIKTLDFSAGEYIVGRISKVPSINFGYPVMGPDKKLIAILSAGIRLDRYDNFLRKANLPGDSTFTITDHKGIRLFRFPENHAIGPGTPVPEDSFRKMSGEHDLGTFETTGDDGVYRFYGYKQLRLREDAPPYLYLSVGYAKNQIFQSANRETMAYLSVLGILGLLMMCAVWMFANNFLIRPIKKLVETTQLFGKGEMGTRTGLPHSPNELGLLAKSFDDMASLLEMRDIERKKAGEALRASEEMFRLLIENAPDAICVLTQGLFAYVNPACVKLMNAASPDQLLGKGMQERIHPDCLEEANKRELIINVEKKRAPNAELKCIRIDGSIIDIETSAVPINYNGHDGALIFARDISERKRADKELRESEARLKIAMDIAKLVQWEYDVKTGMFSFDEQFYALHGTTSRDAGGPMMTAEAYARKFMPPGESHLLAKAIAETLTITDPNFTNQMEHRIIRADGEERHVIVRYGVVCDQTGRVVKARGANQDVTERKRAEKEREHLNRLNKLILYAVSEGIIGLDAEGRGVFANPSATAKLGYEWEEMIGADMHDLIHHSKADGSVYPRHECPSCISLKTGNPHRMMGGFFWRKNGNSFPVVFSSTPIVEAGAVIGVVVTFLDITRRKKDEAIKCVLEAKLAQAQKLEAIGTLAGGIAHDFNNILSPIIGFTELALNEIPHSSQVGKNLEQVLKAGLRAKDLVKQILTFSRPGGESEMAPLEIGMIVKEVMKLLRSSLPATIEIRQNLEKGRALADATQIHQVLMNLCVNAAHAMDNDGVLEVNLTRVDLRESDLKSLSLIGIKPGPFFKLSVSDTGSGMDAATMQRIFEPYFTTKEVGKGTGLGLAVVHGIVKRHEGAVSVQSVVGKGTTFSVYIPEIKREDEAPLKTVDELPGGNENILLVDDEPVMVEMGSMILERLGYQVTGETDSARALELFNANAGRFDLIITDYTMPKLTGTDLAKEIHRIRPGIPIIMCTGFSEKVTPSNAAEFGVEHIMKPFVANDIAELIRKLLDKTG